MLKKWYFGILTTALAILVVMQQDTVVSHQEIVLEFVNIEMNSPEAQTAITHVKNQLRALGIKSTQISKGFEHGKLKIAYYSDANLTSVKRMLSTKQQLPFDLVFHAERENKPTTNENEEKDAQEYRLDIYEVQNNTDLGSDFVVHDVFNLKKDTRRNYITSDWYMSALSVSENQFLLNIKVAQKTIAATTLAFEDNSTYTIPEVRAGPLS